MPQATGVNTLPLMQLTGPLRPVSPARARLRAAALDLARAYAALGDSDQARTALDMAVDQGSGGLGYYERGRMRAEQGDTDGAREDFQEALRQALDAKDDALRAQVEAELAKLN